MTKRSIPVPTAVVQVSDRTSDGELARALKQATEHWESLQADLHDRHMDRGRAGTKQKRKPKSWITLIKKPRRPAKAA